MRRLFLDWHGFVGNMASKRRRDPASGRAYVCRAIIDAREFHLDAATYQYRVETRMEHGVVLTYPFKVAVPFEELVE